MTQISSKKENNCSLWQIFITFVKIGGLTFGGGLAMIPILEHELVHNRNWFNDKNFADTLIITSSAPGPFATNMAAYTGSVLRGIPGAIAAILGNILIPFWLIILISVFLSSQHPVLNRFFVALRPAVIGLILSAGLRFGGKSFSKALDWILGGITLILMMILDISPVFYIITGGIIGIIYFLHKNKKDKEELL